ncbi:hypothetical protein Pan44_19000 [Caulifigura coniformis]|uniref:Prepilin-type N-terminal cleavage/methylation domain-containing protein n=1 Tax=Caulifigura coniformis TaxID=2527983 RepID=A0A517SCN1_9PLAN|nr:prepilin-type N-terminal cleavage/methylation domain-containing protein [Caulifigura coniformis]QDT53874.1 hypothetical protein Pan44_19000 [Caulifigura coniformis]
MAHPDHHRHAAFTLVELSIVLVIVALIIGGIVVGRELITVSKLRADISLIQQFDQNVQTFKTKYGCLPGDCVQPERFFTGLAWNEEGNGDGVIGFNTGTPGTVFRNGSFSNNETSFAMDQMARAGLSPALPFSTTGANASVLPALKSTPSFKFMIQAKCNSVGAACYTIGGHYYYLGITSGGPTILNSSPTAYTPAEGFAIDSKIDDGKAITGKVESGFVGGNYFMPMPSVWNPTSYSCPAWHASQGLNGSCDYDKTRTDKALNILISSSGI